MNNLCTIIIPTYNRPDRLKRLLYYYSKYGNNFSIIVADSSSNENKMLNSKNVLVFTQSNIQYLDNYSFKINPSNKLKDALNYVNTRYTVFCADDDFITPNGINKSVEFLENNQDFSVALGYFISFHLKNEGKREQKICWNPSTDLDKSITFPEPESRLASHLSNYQFATFYAVHRTNLLKMIFGETIKYTEDDRFGELLPSMLDLIYGKVKRTDVLYDARELIISSSGHTTKNFNDFIKEKTYKRKYNKFRECLVKHLIKSSQINSDEAKELIDKAMTEYLNKYCSKSFKGILIGKMSNLLNALDLPESINKSIRMLYKKIFTSKYNLNKSKEIDDFRKKIESPNSKYFDDFERIRKHVLLHAKNNNENIKDTVCN